MTSKLAAVAKRPYRQTARAAAARDLRRRVVVAFHDLMLTRWIDDATLDDAAAMAGTTRRTVIRLFGGKDGLIEEVLGTMLRSEALRRHAVPADAGLDASLEALLDHYERSGDFVVRLLAQEERHPALKPQAALGRRGHRAWAAERFGAAPGLGEAERERLVTELVVVTDVYAWKLLRRDLGLSRAETARAMAEMIVRLTEGRGP